MFKGSTSAAVQYHVGLLVCLFNVTSTWNLKCAIHVMQNGPTILYNQWRKQEGAVFMNDGNIQYSLFLESRVFVSLLS